MCACIHCCSALLQSKWGYQNLSVASAAVSNYSAAGIPLECLFVDIEYMGDNFRTMTFSEGESSRNLVKANIC
jgi:alpha-glucosidase (family GH31 glycosyl hydrolase)